MPIRCSWQRQEVVGVSVQYHTSETDRDNGPYIDAGRGGLSGILAGGGARRTRSLWCEEEAKMAKVLYCKDVGFDCDGVIRAETEAEVLKQVAEHAEKVHDLREISEEVLAKVRASIRDE
jgi:predicted small metal-binding protein